MLININNSNDEFYRYKMEELSITSGGSGNGIFTLINNIDSISNSLNTPSEIILKYLGHYLGSRYNDKKKSFTGNHNINFINIGLFQYIKSFVICSFCNIPELNYNLVKKTLICKCSACGKIKEIISINKMDTKCIDIIIKYLEKKEWKLITGNIVLETTTNLHDNNFNPFI